MSQTTFAYRACLRDGTIEEGEIEAENSGSAFRRLARENKRPLALTEKRQKSRSARWTPRGNGKASEKLITSLAPLLRAGFNVSAALQVAIATERDPATVRAWQAVADATAGGKSFHAAFGGMAGTSPEVQAMIASGESSGHLADVVERIAEIQGQAATRRRALIEALAYPAFLLAMVVAATLFLALFLMPALEPVFESGSVEKPLIVHLLSVLSAFLRESWTLAVPIALIALATTAALMRTPQGRAAGAKLILRLPLIGSLVREAAVLRFLEMLALLIGNGVRIVEALRLSSSTIGVPSMREALEGAREEVANGSSLRSAFERARLFDAPTLGMVGIGEESNTLPLLLKRASQVIDVALRRKIERATALLMPAVTIGMGLLIGLLVISVMTALLSINEVAIR